MGTKGKRIVLPAFLIYSCVNLATFLISYGATLIENELLGAILEYIGYYTVSAAEFLAPPIIATLVLTVFSDRGIPKAILSALLISSAKLFYVFPVYYLEYVYGYGSLDAAILSLLTCFGVVILTALGVTASLYIALFVLQKVLKRSHRKTVEYLPELLTERSGVDFLAATNLSLLVFVLLRFLAELITEIVYTVEFFISYGSDYSSLEILTMLFNYVFLFILLVAGYFLSVLVKNLATKDKEAEEAADTLH